MFDINKDHIKTLNDTDLRELIGRLCEAEMEAGGKSPAYVTWGGAQTAIDGGVDVRVQVDTEWPGGYVPKSQTVIQVKRPDMAAGAIENEMCPAGCIRTSIVELNDLNGAYVIASSGSDVSDLRLRERIEKMKSIADDNGLTNLYIDFYDCQRIVSWMRHHPSVILWIREKVGAKVEGWQGFANWSNPQSPEETYLYDEEIRLSRYGEHYDITTGINLLRDQIRIRDAAIRLVGLSGVGKTRLLQALFDDTIGLMPLNKSQVFYADMIETCNPSPESMAANLKIRTSPSILIIDNCSSERHGKLAELCKNSNVSLVTVEYDIADNQPPETDVYSLEPSSHNLIENLIRTRYPQLDAVTCHRISAFSDGNARCALAVAQNVGKADDLASLNDKDLFDRLFWQRNEKDEELFFVAQLCSLVYSFSLDKVEGYYEFEEYKFLAAVGRIDSLKFYRKVAELERRGLIQKRTIWRALLPHVIANRLAKQALEDFPAEAIRDSLVKNRRLLNSFAHRLSYFHTNQKAVNIADIWVKEFVGRKLAELDTIDSRILKYLAPLVPSQVLEIIEYNIETDFDNFMSYNYSGLETYLGLVKQIAYEQENFIRCINLLIEISIRKSERPINRFQEEYINPFFRLAGSGTHATLEQRLGIINELLNSANLNKQNLGLDLLAILLDRGEAYVSMPPSFGSHKRDIGYYPKSKYEFVDWYRNALNFAFEAVKKAKSDQYQKKRLKSIIANGLMRLWTIIELEEILFQLVEDMVSLGFWPEGYRRVRSYISHAQKRDSNDEHIENFNVLDKMIDLLMPKTVQEEFIFYLGTNHYTFRDDEVFPSKINDAEIFMLEKGKEYGQLINIEDVTNEVLFYCCTSDGWFAHTLGMGVGQTLEAPMKFVSKLNNQMLELDNNLRKTNFIAGLLGGMKGSHPDLCQSVLQYYKQNEELKNNYLLLLKIILPTDTYGLLMEAMDENLYSEGEYESFLNSITINAFTVEEVKTIFYRISNMPNGKRASIHIFNHCYYEEIKNNALPPAVRLIGQRLLNNYAYDEDISEQQYTDHLLGEMFSACFTEIEDREAKDGFYKYIAKQIDDDKFGCWRYESLSESMICHDPKLALDVFLGEKQKISLSTLRFFQDSRYNSYLNKLDSTIILEWCNDEPTTRYPQIAYLIKPYIYDKYGMRFTPFALKLIELSPDCKTVIAQFYSRLHFYRLSGTIEEQNIKRGELWEQLSNHPRSDISNYANKVLKEWRKLISQDHQRYSGHMLMPDSSFEPIH